MVQNNKHKHHRQNKGSAQQNDKPKQKKQKVKPNVDHTPNKRRTTCWECDQEGHLARDYPNKKGTQLLMDGEHDWYETTEEFTFAITARSYHEIEEIIIEDILPMDEEPDPLNELLIFDGEEEELHLSDIHYDLMHTPQDHHQYDTPFHTPQVHFHQSTEEREEWSNHPKRPMFAYLSAELRPPTPPIRNHHHHNTDPFEDDEDEIMLAHNGSTQIRFGFETHDRNQDVYFEILEGNLG